MDCGTLTFLIRSRPHLPECVIAYVMKEICEGVGWLHRLHRLHRDLKSENILVSRIFPLCLYHGDKISARFLGWGQTWRFWICAEPFSRKEHTYYCGWNSKLDGAGDYSRWTVWMRGKKWRMFARGSKSWHENLIGGRLECRNNWDWNGWRHRSLWPPWSESVIISNFLDQVDLTHSYRIIVNVRRNLRAEIDTKGYNHALYSFVNSVVVKKRSERSTIKQLLEHEFLDFRCSRKYMKKYVIETNNAFLGAELLTKPKTAMYQPEEDEDDFFS